MIKSYWNKLKKAVGSNRLLVIIVVLGTLLRLGAAILLGDSVVPLPAAWDQVFFHDVALNLLSGRGFVYSNPPWPFIHPLAPTAYTSFLYQVAIAAIYLILGPHPLAARLLQALLCSLLPLQVYGLVCRILKGEPRHERDWNSIALVAAGITAFYAYFIYFSATLMTDGPYLVTVTWALILTLDLAERPTLIRWTLWGLAVGLTILLRQVFMPIVLLLLLFIIWKTARRVSLLHFGTALAVISFLILPWTIRNYLVFHRFLLLNSQAGQVFWNANHPALGTQFQYAPMFPIPDDLKGADEVTINDELMRRGIQIVMDDPQRFVLLSLSRLEMFFLFYPASESGLFSNIARTISFGISLPFMLAGLALAIREWRRWLLLYLFATAYVVIHVISWVQIRYRMPIDLVLVPFAALFLVALAQTLNSALQKRIQWIKA